MPISPVTAILNQAIRREYSPLNILSYPTHERAQSGLTNTPHTYYLLQGEGIKQWVDSYAKLPDNHILLPPNSPLPTAVDFDLVWSQNKYAHFPLSHKLSRELHCPLVTLEHTLPPPNWPENQIRQASSMRGNINVYISEYSRDKWLVEPTEDVRVIHHAIDSELFKPEDEFSNIPRKNAVLSVANDFINRNWCMGFDLWREVINGLPHKVVGDTKGLSEKAKDVAHLVSLYNEHSVYLNTTLISPISTATLEAASCGCAIVSTNNCMTPEVFTQGKDAFLSNDPKELKYFCMKLLKDEDLARKMGREARKTIIEKFSPSLFIKKWTDLFEEASNISFLM